MINYALQKKQKADELKALLEQPVSMAGIQDSVSSSREDFLSKAGVGGPALGEATQMPALQRKTASSIAKTGYDANRTRQDQMFTELMNMATDAGMGLAQAKEYAYKVMAQNKEQAFQSDQNAKDMQLRQRLANMGDSYADQGVALADQYQPSYDPTGAIMRMLLGTGTMVGMSSYYQNRLNQSINAPKTVSISPVAGQGGYPAYDQYYNPPGAGTNDKSGRTAGTY